MRNEYSRVGMVKQRVKTAPGFLSGRKADATLEGNECGVRKTTYGALPSTPRQLVKFRQKREILPKKLGGSTLELRTTEKYGDKVNGELALCATGGPDEHRRPSYKSIRPRL